MKWYQMELEITLLSSHIFFYFPTKKEDSACSQSLLYVIVSLFYSWAFSEYPVLSFLGENWMFGFAL